MQIASLGSGSKGNATLVRSDHGCVLIDCGFSLPQFTKRLNNLELEIDDIDAILVTHEHSDHGSGVSRLARKYDIPVWMTVGTARALAIEDFNIIHGGQATIEINDLSIQAVTVPHDAAEPVQYIFTQISSGRKLGILTDSGHISSHIQQAYQGLHGLLLEFNYDERMLQNGPYPPALKRRVSGNQGHLSNSQSFEMLQQMDRQQLDLVIAAHLSEKNNSIDIVSKLLQPLANEFTSILACQQKGFDWVSI